MKLVILRSVVYIDVDEYNIIIFVRDYRHDDYVLC